ncbi:MAG TPA: hypothetical protein VLA24_05050 [Pseudomonadales bacterium]|nr:hypothetical protein [Pseudomonadales bacterium]
MVYAESEVLYRVIGICREFTEESYMPVLRVAKQMRNTLSSMLIMVMVAACGGSGPAGAPVAGSPNTGGGSNTTPINDNVITLSWEDGSTENTVEDIMPRTLNITLKDNTGTAVVNEIVEVTTSLGTLFPSSGRVATNATGVASIQIDVTGAENGEAGAINVIQTDQGNGASVSARLTISAISSATSEEDANVLSLAWVDGSASNIISDTSSRTLQITLTDSQGSPLDGELLTVVTTLGLLSPSSGSIATNSAGVASIDIDISGAENNEAGVLFVTHTDTVSQQQVEKNLTITASVTGSGASNAISVALADNNFEVVDTSPENVTVNLKDSAGNNLANQVVTVSTTLGSLSPSSGVVTTDANGNAVVQLDVSGAEDKEGGTLVARHTDSTGDTVSANVNFSASITQAGDANVLAITLGDTDFTIVDTSPEIITINLKDSQGNNLQNQILSISSTLGVLSPASGNVTTDASGNAVVQLDVSGADMGEAGTIVASHTNTIGDTVTKSVNFNASITLANDTNVMTIALGDANFTIVDTAPENVIVNLKDSAGNNLANEVISMTTTLGKLSPTSGVVTTDANGNAVVQLDVTGAEDGEGGTLVASHTNGSGDTVTKSTNFNASITLANDANVMTIALGDANFTIVDTAPENVTVKLKDSAGNNLVNEVITITTTLGSLSPTSGVVTTDASGNAVVQLDVSGAEDAEGGTLIASHTNDNGDTVTKRVNFTASITPQNTTSGYRLESAFFATSILDESAIGAADALGDQTGTLAALVAARTSEEGATVNAVQNSIYAVRLTNAGGDTVEGAIINVATSVGSLTPASGRVLTNTNGIAYVTLQAGASDPGAAGTVTATVSDASIANNFAIGSVTLEIGYYNTTTNAFSSGIIGVNSLTDGSVSLSPAGTASLQVGVVDENGALFTTPLTINFTSSCAGSNQAAIDTGVTTVNGIATATYEATGCATTDSLSASVQELADVTASGALTVADASANSIRFVSATPTNVALQGTGGTGRQEFSTLVFEVIDEAGQPKESEPVSVKLSTVIGGVNLTGDLDDDGDLDNSATDERLYTNANGRVSVIVNAGTVPTPVRVEASITVAGNTISSVSDNLIISTGLPDSNSFSLSAAILTPAGYEYDGFESQLTLRAADAFNNPVPDGTTINFGTEYGRVVDTCTTIAGNCTVTWNSQSPRSPDDTSATGIVLNLLNSSCDSDSNGTADVDSQGATIAATPCPVLSVANTDVGNVTGSNFTSVLFDLAGDPDYPGQVFGGRSTILAYAIGEESFVDANGNGVFDSGEAFTDLGEPFVDHNEDGVFGNPNTTGACVSTANVGTYNCANWQEGGEEEEFVDFNSDGQYTPANGIYNGSLCSNAAELAGDCEKVLVYVSDTLTLNVGGSTPFIGIYDTSNVLQAGGDQHVDVSASGSTAIRRIIISDIFNGRLPAGTTVSATADNCKLVGLTDYEFVDTSVFGNHAVDFTLTEDTSTDASFGVVTITVTTPDRAGGVVATTSFNCQDND